jgi:hypothetical protein
MDREINILSTQTIEQALRDMNWTTASAVPWIRFRVLPMPQLSASRYMDENAFIEFFFEVDRVLEDYNWLFTFQVLEMAAISTLQVREAAGQLVRRENWAGKEAGVIVVFCIVFIVAVGLIGLFVSRALGRRRAARAT